MGAEGEGSFSSRGNTLSEDLEESESIQELWAEGSWEERRKRLD